MSVVIWKENPGKQSGSHLSLLQTCKQASSVAFQKVLFGALVDFGVAGTCHAFHPTVHARDSQRAN